MDYKKVFDRFEDQNIFIKTTKGTPIDGAQKAALNRRGNVLYNTGDIEGAKRIFLTTGYSDGLSRIGDYYRTENRYMDALEMYRIAPDHRKLEAMARDLSAVIKQFIYEETGSQEERC